MGIAYRSVQTKESGFVQVGVSWGFFPVILDILYRESRFLFVPDGSPMTNVGDDGEGMVSTHLQEYQKADFWIIRHRRALKRRNFMYSW